MTADRDGLVQLLLGERTRITAFAYAVARDAHAADDIFQQVVLQALQAKEPFRDAAHAVAWSLRCARHRAIDLLRQRESPCLDDAVLDRLEARCAAAPADGFQRRVEALHQCLDQLPQHARRVLELRYAEGLPCDAVARRLSRSLDSVYKGLSRLHQQLRECVERRLVRDGIGAEAT